MAAANEAATFPVRADAARAAPAGASTTRSYAWYVAALLALAQVVAVMDRFILSVVLESVKRDLQLTDTELGLLQGPSFVLLFAVASLPFGAWPISRTGV